MQTGQSRARRKDRNGVYHTTTVEGARVCEEYARLRETVLLNMAQAVAGIQSAAAQATACLEQMERGGCSPDNAACEGFLGRLKTELFYSRDWQTVSTDQFIEVVDSHIRWVQPEFHTCVVWNID
jgi:hypothetical protein